MCIILIHAYNLSINSYTFLGGTCSNFFTDGVCNQKFLKTTALDDREQTIYPSISLQKQYNCLVFYSGLRGDGKEANTVQNPKFAL